MSVVSGGPSTAKKDNEDATPVPTLGRERQVAARSDAGGETRSFDSQTTLTAMNWVRIGAHSSSVPKVGRERLEIFSQAC